MCTVFSFSLDAHEQLGGSLTLPASTAKDANCAVCIVCTAPRALLLSSWLTPGVLLSFRLLLVSHDGAPCALSHHQGQL